MSYTIAVAGKGGTGKTTIAGLVIRYLAENKKTPILAIDADPNSNLGDVLGITPKENIGAIIDEISKNIDKIPAGMTKDRYIEYRVQSAIEESSSLDLLAMGRPEGPGCYCYANNTLRNINSKIASDYKFVVIDNEAGLEHLSRRTTRKADCLLIISDPTPVGIKSAKRIYDLVKELNIEIKKFIVLVNRTKDSQDKEGIKKEFSKIKIDDLKFVPNDEEVLKLSLEGKPLMELEKGSVALEAITSIMEAVCR
ncbi:MAG: AAA family ATPase [Candidatus Omnitrophota bacterium]|nr:AAA family ATPase [Candidatus Omnitrophota bacterium]